MLISHPLQPHWLYVTAWHVTLFWNHGKLIFQSCFLLKLKQDLVSKLIFITIIKIFTFLSFFVNNQERCDSLPLELKKGMLGKRSWRQSSWRSLTDIQSSIAPPVSWCLQIKQQCIVTIITHMLCSFRSHKLIFGSQLFCFHYIPPCKHWYYCPILMNTSVDQRILLRHLMTACFIEKTVHNLILMRNRPSAPLGFWFNLNTCQLELVLDFAKLLFSITN